MCTVSFVRSAIGFALTSSRDESPLRETLPIGEIEYNDMKLQGPRDARSGGTWLACQSSKRVACLLNGAKNKHVRKLPYNRSRGLVLLDSFQYSFDEIAQKIDLQGVEPFTLVLIDYENELQLIELVWDGNESEKNVFSTKIGATHFWSSSTLYEKEVREKRLVWFHNWLNSPNNKNEFDHVWDFHNTSHSTNPTEDIVMQRERVETVSVTQIKKLWNEKEEVFMQENAFAHTKYIV